MRVQQICRAYPIKVPLFLVLTNGAYIMMFNAIKAICRKAPETPEAKNPEIIGGVVHGIWMPFVFATIPTLIEK